MKDASLPAPHIDQELASDAALLQAIYETALLPDRYDALMDTWQTRLSAVVEAQIDSDLTRADQILSDPSFAYLETSLQVLLAVDQGRGQINPFNDRPGRARMAFSPDGAAVWYNGRAKDLFGLSRNSTLNHLRFPEPIKMRLHDALTELGKEKSRPDGRTPFVLHMAAETGTAQRFMVARPLKQPGSPPLLLLEEGHSGWSTRLAEALREAFGLTVRETEILGAVCDGKSLSFIASEQERKVSTLRSQMKSILRKTGTSSQAQLVTLVFSIAAYLDPSDLENECPETGLWHHRLPDGRSMPYHVFGPETGRVGLFIHGMLDGVRLLRLIEPLLFANDICMIAPHRPGFGTAPVCGRPVADLPCSVAQDILHLLDNLGVRTFPVVGHMAGSVYAFAVAAQGQERVSAIINVSGGVPIRSLMQLKHMSRRQRTVAYTARFAPAALPLILHAGIRQIESGGVQQFIAALYEDAPADQRCLGNAEIRTLIAEGVQFATAQGYHGFQCDSYQVVRDWSQLVADSTCPVHLIHGRHDPVVLCMSIEDFAARHSTRVTTFIAEAEGQLVLYSRPDILIDVLQRVLHDTGNRMSRAMNSAFTTASPAA